jgi:hypothetical protein
MKTPYDAAIAVSEFVVAITGGIPRWSKENTSAKNRLSRLILERWVWQRRQARRPRP